MSTPSTNDSSSKKDKKRPRYTRFGTRIVSDATRAYKSIRECENFDNSVVGRAYWSTYNEIGRLREKFYAERRTLQRKARDDALATTRKFIQGWKTFDNEDFYGIRSSEFEKALGNWMAHGCPTDVSAFLKAHADNTLPEAPKDPSPAVERHDCVMDSDFEDADESDESDEEDEEDKEDKEDGEVSD
jgi:hypothetical protein